MVAAERRITDNERINIIVEYACLGQEPKVEVIFHLHRYNTPIYSIELPSDTIANDPVYMGTLSAP